MPAADSIVPTPIDIPRRELGIDAGGFEVLPPNGR
jgi:hypothetical protein